MKTSLLFVALGGFLSLTVGCGGDSASSTGDSTVTMDSAPPPTVDEHAHPSEGPHHGSLVELGNEEFHAEVVHTDDTVTIYILDSGAKNAVPIDAKTLTINLNHDGTPEQFKLAASPDSGDPSGKSSRFLLADAELVGHLDDAAAAPKLSVTINGAPYRGEIHHDHDAEGHGDHGHEH